MKARIYMPETFTFFMFCDIIRVPKGALGFWLFRGGKKEWNG